MVINTQIVLPSRVQKKVFNLAPREWKFPFFIRVKVLYWTAKEIGRTEKESWEENVFSQRHSLVLKSNKKISFNWAAGKLKSPCSRSSFSINMQNEWERKMTQKLNTSWTHITSVLCQNEDRPFPLLSQSGKFFKKMLFLCLPQLLSNIDTDTKNKEEEICRKREKFYFQRRADPSPPLKKASRFINLCIRAAKSVWLHSVNSPRLSGPRSFCWAKMIIMGRRWWWWWWHWKWAFVAMANEGNGRPPIFWPCKEEEEEELLDDGFIFGGDQTPIWNNLRSLPFSRLWMKPISLPFYFKGESALKVFFWAKKRSSLFLEV